MSLHLCQLSVAVSQFLNTALPVTRIENMLHFTALYWAAFNTICALLSSHMTNKDDDDDDDDLNEKCIAEVFL